MKYVLDSSKSLEACIFEIFESLLYFLYRFCILNVFKSKLHGDDFWWCNPKISDVLSYPYLLSLHTKCVSPLLQIFRAFNLDIMYVRELVKYELSPVVDANVIFRTNTFTTKTIDAFMKIYCSRYLVKMLQRPIQQIYR